jgi:hypothetical protein
VLLLAGSSAAGCSDGERDPGEVDTALQDVEVDPESVRDVRKRVTLPAEEVGAGKTGRRWQWYTGRSLAVLAGAVALWPHAARAASVNVTIESVSDYSYVLGHHENDIECIAETDGFYSGMALFPPFAVSPSRYWKNGDVWDFNFYDPQLTGYGADNDVLRFDPPGSAISYACAHGSCDDTMPTTCTSSAQCGAGRYCPGSPPSVYSRRCIKNVTQSKLLSLSSSVGGHANLVLYGGTNAGPGTVAWGESPQSSAWRGAGTNGGANLVVISNSCGLRAPYWEQVVNPLAGAHMIAGIMPVSVNNCPLGKVCNWGVADAYTDSNRGGFFAYLGYVNPQGAVSAAWGYALNALSSYSNSSCPDATNTFTYGGGKGLKGCGCHFVVSRDHTPLRSIWHALYENWVELRDDANDATGTAGGAFGTFYCNYDNITYPFY